MMIIVVIIVIIFIVVIVVMGSYKKLSPVVFRPRWGPFWSPKFFLVTVIFFPSLVAPILENDIERRSRHSWVVYSAS